MSEQAEGSLKTVIQQYLDECHLLRTGAKLPHPDAGPKELADALLDIRSRLDQVEWRLQRLMRIRATARRQSDERRAVADDAWDAAISKQRKAPVARDDYTSGRERHAEANLAVLGELRAAREANELLLWCNERVEIVRLHHRGLADIRQDLLALLRVFQFESNLER